jgi:hypothetical protein
MLTQNDWNANISLEAITTIVGNKKLISRSEDRVVSMQDSNGDNSCALAGTAL